MGEPAAAAGSAALAGSLVGRLLDLDVGAVATGGACVARAGDDPRGRVVFVRHALPGERVRARVTEDRGGSFCRADAVEVLRASADRVQPPCGYARPGGCGGCDWQHAAGPAQRGLKADVVREQFARLAGLDVTALLTAVEELPGGLLGWRTGITYAVDRHGRPGLHRHGSHTLEHVRRCLLGVPGVGDSPVLADTWRGLNGVEVVRGDGDGDESSGTGEVTVLGHRPGPGRQARGRRPPDRIELISGPAVLHHDVRGRRFEVAARGFWQGHPAAATTLAAALLDGVRPRPGERVLDLYAGAGAFTAALAEAVGPAGWVLGVETDATAVADAERNLADLPWAQVRRGRVDERSVTALDGPFDVVVLDPPRAGAGTATMAALLERRPRVIGYVSCDPATLARDVAVALRAGWPLQSLRAFDAFPMTQHVECLAVLGPRAAA